MSLPDEDRYLKTREDLIDRMTVCLGGRVAEQLVFGAVTTGAANDLQKVAEITHAMVHDYAMAAAASGQRALHRPGRRVGDQPRRIHDEEQRELAFEAEQRRPRDPHHPPRQARRARRDAARARGPRPRATSTASSPASRTSSAWSRPPGRFASLRWTRRRAQRSTSAASYRRRDRFFALHLERPAHEGVDAAEVRVGAGLRGSSASTSCRGWRRRSRSAARSRAGPSRTGRGRRRAGRRCRSTCCRAPCTR